ncbi:MAG: hypothetical protein HVN34_05315 [Methanobacteriaceae archaeon]|jgi:hypothetical protein|nr:hypothetical protein [Methanobacteriaceae archaeon]
MWSSFTDYIGRNYGHAHNIVEVGVGTFSEVAQDLQNLNFNIIMTDIIPSPDIIQDDICHPDLKIYKGAELIYSIRPPEELHPCLVRVAGEVGADLIIKPLSTDSINSKEKFKLINYKKAVFYVTKF